MKKLIYLIIFLVLVSFSNALQCSVSNTVDCPGQNKILGLSSNTNAHAQLYNINTYAWSLCCDENLLSGTCVNALKLSSTSNAHVGDLSSSYTVNLCLNADCKIATSNSDLSYIPLISLSSNTNAHVANSGAYTTKLYCKYLGGGNIPACTPNPVGTTNENTDVLCSDTIDNDCDGKVNCADPDCSSAPNCVITPETCASTVCKEYTNTEDCRLETDCNCYYQTKEPIGCYSCVGYTGGCTGITDENTCDYDSDLNTPNNCGSYCKWTVDNSLPNGGSCSNSNTCPDLDDDSICDSGYSNFCKNGNTVGCKDNCPPMGEKPLGWYNPDQEDLDDDGIGDACDADNLNYDEDISTIDVCKIKDTTQNYCLEANEEPIELCDDLTGIACSSNQLCSGMPIVTSDSNNCCIIGECGSVQYTLTGTQYNVESGDCVSVNEEGVGKKTVIKYNANGQQQGITEIDCTILPTQETVPFYTLISVILTISILIAFYSFKRNKLF